MGLLRFHFLILFISFFCLPFRPAAGEVPGDFCPRSLRTGILSGGYFSQNESSGSLIPFLFGSGSFENRFCFQGSLEQQTRETTGKYTALPHPYSDFERKRKQSFVPSMQFFGNGFFFSAGRRFLPSGFSSYLLDAEALSLLEDFPSGRETESLFLGAPPLASFSTGLFWVRNTRGAGVFLSTRDESLFVAWHPFARNGAFFWKESETGLFPGCPLFLDLVFQDGDTEGRGSLGERSLRSSCPFFLEAERKSYRDSLAFDEGEDIYNRKGKSGSAYAKGRFFKDLEVILAGEDMGTGGIRMAEARWFSPFLFESPWKLFSGFRYSRTSRYLPLSTVSHTRSLLSGISYRAKALFGELLLTHIPHTKTPGVECRIGYRVNGVGVSFSGIQNPDSTNWIFTNHGSRVEAAHRFYPLANRVLRISIRMRLLYISIESVEEGPLKGKRFLFQGNFSF